MYALLIRGSPSVCSPWPGMDEEDDPSLPLGKALNDSRRIQYYNDYLLSVAGAIRYSTVRYANVVQYSVVQYAIRLGSLRAPARFLWLGTTRCDIGLCTVLCKCYGVVVPTR